MFSSIKTVVGELAIEVPTVNKKEITQKVQKILSTNHYQISSEKMLEFIDLTSLRGYEDEGQIHSLCLLAKEAKTAAICVYPQFAQYCKKTHPEIQVAVVGLHFPRDNQNLSLQETQKALQVPVDEVDMVINLSLVHSRKFQDIYDEINSLAQECHGRDILLKVILETGTFEEMGLISVLSQLSIAAGADFIKTSTGKTPIGATLEAAYLMLRSILESGRPVGLKPSGGIGSYEEALPYFQLAHELLGEKAIHPRRFRIGASGLVNRLLDK